MKRIVTSALLIGAVFTLLSGCAGYQLGSVKPSVYAGIDNIHVPMFANNTLEPRVSSLVTNAVLKEIQADGTYKVTNRQNCDAILVGRIRQISKRQLRAIRTDTLRSKELRLFLYVDWHFEDPSTGRRIDSLDRSEGDSKIDREDDKVYKARPGRVIGETIQIVDPSFQVSERNAIAVAAQDAAKKIVSQAANGW